MTGIMYISVYTAVNNVISYINTAARTGVTAKWFQSESMTQHGIIGEATNIGWAATNGPQLIDRSLASEFITVNYSLPM